MPIGVACQGMSVWVQSPWCPQVRPEGSGLRVPRGGDDPLPTAPLTKDFVLCGWGSGLASHDLSHPVRPESLHAQIAAAMDYSTKSRAREIIWRFDDRRPAPKPLRSEAHPERLAELSAEQQSRVDADNRACS